MKNKPLPDVNYLHLCFAYDAQSGNLVWRSRPLRHFASKKVGLGWNTKYADRIAGHVDHSTGYKKVILNGVKYSQSRIIFKMQRGYDPDYVDHRNTNRRDNTPANIRNCTKAQNNYNRRASSLSNTGVKGCHWNKKAGKFKAEITKDGSKHYLGLFDAIEDAKAAYYAAAQRLFGEFAPLPRSVTN
ncbi:MAG: HNH endonuclease [Rhodospirillales bacterium]|nr:HNH endonuclease [Rhodospirillales bacterium]